MERGDQANRKPCSLDRDQQEGHQRRAHVMPKAAAAITEKVEASPLKQKEDKSWLQGATEAETGMKKEEQKGQHLFDKKKGFFLFVLLSSYAVMVFFSSDPICLHYCTAAT